MKSTTICAKKSKHYRNLKGLLLVRPHYYVISSLIFKCLLILIIKEYITIIPWHFPTGMSIKGMRHFHQVHQAGDMFAFDHGPEENLKRYGSVEPFRYNLKQVTTPVYIFWSEADYFVPKEVFICIDTLIRIHFIPHYII